MADESQWRTSGFRQSVVQKINEAILQTGNSSSRNAIEMEGHAFQKAKNKDEYLAFVARLILHVREMNSKNKNAQNNGDVNNPVGPGMPDPINALQNMASPGTRNPQMMGMAGGPTGGGNMGVGGNIPTSNLLQTLTQQRPGPQNQQQQMQQNMGRGGGPMLGQVGGPMSGNMGVAVGPISGGGGGNQMNPGNMNMGMGVNQMNQMGVGNQQNQMNPGLANQMSQLGGNQMSLNSAGGMGGNSSQIGGMGNMGQMVPNQNQIVNQMNMNPTQLNPNQMNQMGSAMNVGMVNQMGQLNPNTMNQMNNNPNQVGIVGQQQPQQQQQQSANQMGNLGLQSGMGPQNPMVAGQGQMNPNQMLNMQQTLGRKPQDMMMNNSSGVFPGVRNVTPNQFLRQSPSPSVPSPVAMNQNLQSGSMVASPALVPSPSPMTGMIPGGAQRSVGGMAPSPSSALNTPGQAGAVASPLNPQEEQLYREKYGQLTKYIEPLKRMIARMGNDDAEKLLKMNRLLEILCNPSRRIPLETLVKCEKALDKMDFKTNVSIPLKEHQTNNPLLEAVNATLQSQLGNHTLQRTFNPCLEALFGPDIKNLPPSEKRPRYSTDETPPPAGPVIPHTMQGEIARLDQKFKVSLDTSAQPGTKTIKLICCLDDTHLPCVPPVTVSIPEDYPASAPNCNLIEQEYSATPFLSSVQKALTSRISKLPRQFSLSHLLDTWEMSVRQACSPNAVNVSQATVLLGI